METEERMRQMDGTEGHEDFMLIGQELMTKDQLDDLIEQVKVQYKRWPTWCPREWKATHRRSWTWEFGYTRQGLPTCYQVDVKIQEIADLSQICRHESTHLTGRTVDVAESAVCNQCLSTIWWIPLGTETLASLQSKIQVGQTVLVSGKTWEGWFPTLKGWDGRFIILEALMPSGRKDFRVDWHKIKKIICNDLEANRIEHLHATGKLSWEQVMN